MKGLETLNERYALIEKLINCMVNQEMKSDARQLLNALKNESAKVGKSIMTNDANWLDKNLASEFIKVAERYYAIGNKLSIEKTGTDAEKWAYWYVGEALRNTIMWNWTASEHSRTTIFEKSIQELKFYTDRGISAFEKLQKQTV